MRRTIVLVLTGAAVVAGLVQGGALAAPRHATAASGPAVTIRIEGARKTLVPPNLVEPGSGWITRSGAPKGKCPRRSVQGALNRATHGQWKGTWSRQFNEYFITSILGEKPPRHNFWEIFVNYKAASKGACDLKLRRGEQILFADTNGKRHPSALNVVGKSTRSASGTTFRLLLTGFNAHGTGKPLAGVRINGGGIHSAPTNSHGQVEVTDNRPGPLLLRASPTGYIRSETEVFLPSG
ncbi:MAG TPA: DUF4430 domain-containing protein [Solirubrobacteraceae bacterium]|jgi:hypothetical protein